ncbi:MAG: hypothetical protein RI894_1058 [Bacteroidota bacterium]|jgi:phytoene/squalene synthetase
MLALYDQIAAETGRRMTHTYSTSFSLAIALLDSNIRQNIYNIYGFVRLGDEIVDTFCDQNQEELLEQFTRDSNDAISRKFSINPVLHAFQKTVHLFAIERELIDLFIASMRMDLQVQHYDRERYEKYIVGSAEVVGLMCLHVFLLGDKDEYARLRYSAERLGAAFQKINFLRDLKADTETLGRIYFPELDGHSFNCDTKKAIETDIEKDFADGFEGIKQLPKRARFGVYVAYRYYYSLFKKIKNTPAQQVLQARIRVADPAKYLIFAKSYLRNEMNLLSAG